MPPRIILLKDSSNVTSAELSEDGILSVVFKGGKSYRYANVTEAQANEWESAPSSGSWFHTNVKSQPKVHPLVPVEKDVAAKAPTTATGQPEQQVEPPIPATPDVTLSPPPGVPAPLNPVTSAAFDTSDAQRDIKPAKVSPVPRAGRGKVIESDQPPSVIADARELYAAYTANSDNLNYEGKQCPAWEQLTPAVRSHWCAVVLEARIRFEGQGSALANKPWKRRGAEGANDRRER